MVDAKLKGTRITMTIKPDEYEVLCKLGEAMQIPPGEVAKNIVNECVEGLAKLFEFSEENISSDKVLRRLYKMSLRKMLDAFEDIDVD